MATKLILLCVTLVALSYLSEAKEKTVDFKYKSDAVLDCSELKGDKVDFFAKKKSNDTTNAIEANDALLPNDRTIIDGKTLTLKNLREPEIRDAEYSCKDDQGESIQFKKRILPFLYKPEKPSLTITQGGSAVFECKVLYTENKNIEWSWSKENATIDTALKSSGRVTIAIDDNKERTTLTIKEVTEEDKGMYKCSFKDSNGEQEEKIQLRVKNPLAALWPFLAIIGEVIVLCLVILIYEKKCTKKPNAEDDNEQNQTLLKDGQNADLKKRTTKA